MDRGAFGNTSNTLDGVQFFQRLTKTNAAYHLDRARAPAREFRAGQIEPDNQNRALDYNVAEPPEQSCSPLYLLFHRAPVGYLVLDDIGLIRETNETFCRMADQEQDRLIGRSLSEWVTDVERGVFVARYRALFKNPAGQSLEAFVRRGHGSAFYAHLQGGRIDTPPPCWRIDGRSLLLLAVTDLTERKRAEEKLRLAATVFEASAEPIMVTDVRGTIKAVNGAFARTTGYEPQEVIGRNPRILKSGRMPADHYAGLWRTLSETGYWEQGNRAMWGVDNRLIARVTGRD